MNSIKPPTSTQVLVAFGAGKYPHRKAKPRAFVNVPSEKKPADSRKSRFKRRYGGMIGHGQARSSIGTFAGIPLLPWHHSPA